MQALELLAVEVAKIDGDDRLMAVIAEAWQQSGMNLDFLVGHVADHIEPTLNYKERRSRAWDLIEAAYYNLPRKKLRGDARIMRQTLKMLDEAGVLTDKALAHARWGHPEDHPYGSDDVPYPKPTMVEVGKGE